MPISTGFWPEDIKPKIQTPLAILRNRASELTNITEGLLVGNVESMTDELKEQTYHSLDVSVPALNHFRQRLLTIRHRANFVYPVYIAEKFFDDPLSDKQPRQRGARRLTKDILMREYEASTDSELVQLLKRALHTDRIKSTLASLIAMANEEQGEGEEAVSQAVAVAVSAEGPNPERPENESQ